MTAAAVPFSSPGAVKVATWTAFLHVAAMAVQIVLALALLSGLPALATHAMLAWGVCATGALQALMVLALRARVGAWVQLPALALPVLEAVQFWLGKSLQTGAHALLGMLLWCFALAVLIRLCAPELRATRASP